LSRGAIVLAQEVRGPRERRAVWLVPWSGTWCRRRSLGVVCSWINLGSSTRSAWRALGLSVTTKAYWTRSLIWGAEPVSFAHAFRERHERWSRIDIAAT
jgi:hypothetical protein